MNVNFFDDPLIPNLKNFILLSPQPPNCSLITVADFLDQNTGLRDKKLLNFWLNEEMVKALTSIPLNYTNQDDTLVWRFNSNGVYTLKSGYHSVIEEKQFILLPQMIYQRNCGMFQPFQKLSILCGKKAKTRLLLERICIIQRVLKIQFGLKMCMVLVWFV